MTDLLICPECKNGKHQNCDGQVLDPDTDEFGLCECPDTSEVQH